MTDLPACLTGFVDIAEGGTVRLRKDTTPPVACIIIPEAKYTARETMFPAGLDKALQSKYRTTRRLWFVMTDIPADAPADNRIINTTEGASMFWSGFPMPIDAGEWQDNPPETLPEVSYPDIMRLCGFEVPVISPPAPEPTPAPAPEPAVKQYTEYLSTAAAKSPLHGLFAVYRMRIPDGVHTTRKMPCNKYGHTKEGKIGGVRLFDSTAAEMVDVISNGAKQAVGSIRRNLTYVAAKRQEEAWEDEYHALNGALQTENYGTPTREEQAAARDALDKAEKASAEAKAELEYLRTVEISLLLGRRFDASADGIVALDCDGHHPPAEWGAEAIYREVSASGTGDHILYHIHGGIIPDTSANKNKTTIDGREYELFYGLGNGLAISGMQATATPDAPTLNMESPAGRIIDQLIHTDAGATPLKVCTPTAPHAQTHPTPPPPPDEETARRIAEWENDEMDVVRTRMGRDSVPAGASEAMMSIMSRIAGDAAQEAAETGVPYEVIATPERLKRLWEESETYQQEYATGAHAYNESKIEATLRKAIQSGQEDYDDQTNHLTPLNKRIMARANYRAKQPVSPEYPEEPEDEDAVTDARINMIAHQCGSVIEGMYQYYTAGALYSQRKFALFCALEAVGIICGRVWQTDPIVYHRDGTLYDVVRLPGATTTDYLTIIGKTGTGKEDVKRVMETFLGGLGITIAPNVTGASALHAEGMQSPRLVMIQDEAGLRRQSVGGGKGDPYGQRTAETLFMDQYNNRAGVVRPPLYAASKDNPNYQPIKRQAMSCVLISTPGTFEDALHGDDARSGYLGRHVIVQSYQKRTTKLGSEVSDPDEAAELQGIYMESLLKPFFGWRYYHAGKPYLDTYGQLIRPSQAVAWDIITVRDDDGKKINEAFAHQQARSAADEMRDPRMKYQTSLKPVYDETQPYEIVKWGKGAVNALIGTVYEDNERYITDHPEAADILVRKMQHVEIYAMRIALANHKIGLDTHPLEPQQEPQQDIDEEEETRTKDEWEVYETARYADCKSIPDIRRRANEDANARARAWENYHAVNMEAARIEKEKITILNKADDEVKQDIEASLRAVEAELERAKIIYTAKTEAIEAACKRVYDENPPVITAEHVMLAKEIIDIAIESALRWTIESIPNDKWYEAAQDAIRILTEAGTAGIATSVLERKLRKHKLGDKYTMLIDQMRADGRITRGDPSPNGGRRLFLTALLLTEEEKKKLK